MNILVCSMFVSSGWRAELSRTYREKAETDGGARTTQPITKPAQSRWSS